VDGQGLMISDSEILAAAKELWPEIDLESVNLIRTQRPAVDYPGLLKDSRGVDHIILVRAQPSMTTTGLALLWNPEDNMVIYREKGANDAESQAMSRE